MADFSNSTFARTSRQPTPGQPVGLDQVQEEQAAGRLQPWQMPTGSYVDVAQRWYTGANSEGMTNGWDTEFYRTASQQRAAFLDKAIQTGDASWYTRWLDTNPNSPTYNKDATGVALWNDPTAFGRGDGQGIKVGDVFEDGRWVSNLYETYKDDRPTADLLMVDWVLEQEEKAAIWQSDDRTRLTSEAMDARFAENSRDVAAIATQQSFEAEKQQRQAELQSDAWWNVGNVVAPAVAAGTMAATSAAVPALFGGPVSPLIIGGAFVGGAVVGGLGAWANRDQITEMEARAMEIVERAKATYPEDSGFVTDLTTGLAQWGPVLQSGLNPISNIVQGINDDIYSDIGDLKEGMYEIDPDTGKMNGGRLAKGANFAAMLADSALQFTSPFGAAAYATTTGLTVFGGAGEIVTKDAGFNLRTGQFEDYEGARETLSAWGSVGIDAVQMFTAGGLMALGRQARRGLGIEAKAVGTGDNVVLGGMVYKTDELGEALSRRVSIQMAAPSEMVQAVVIGQKARINARRIGQSNRALTADDYYRAAKEMTTTSRYANAFVTGVAEGAEEAVQAVLEPMSFSEDIVMSQVGEAALMGFAGGAGMSVGATITGRAQVSRDRRDRVDSEIAHGLANISENREITDEEWSARWTRMTPAEKRRARILDQRQAARSNSHVKQIEDGLMVEVGATSVIGVQAHNQFTEKGRLEALRDSNPETSNLYQVHARTSHRATGVTGLQQQVFAENAALMSLHEVMNVIRGNLLLAERDLKDQAIDGKSIKEGSAAANAALADVNDRIAAGEQGLTDRQTELQSEVAHFQRLSTALADRITDQQFDLSMAQEVVKVLQEKEDAFNTIDVTDELSRAAALDEINQLIVDMTRGNWQIPGRTQPLSAEEVEAIRRAVEMVFIREPKLGLSSYDLNIPQASHELTFARINRVIQGSMPTFKPKNADNDGDTYAALRTAYIRPDLRNQLRRGVQFFATTSTHAETDASGSVTPVSQVRDVLARDVAGLVLTEAANEDAILTSVASVLADPDPTRQAAARALVKELKGELRKRYTTPALTSRPPVTGRQFSEAWKQFEADLEAGVKDARSNFMNTMVSYNPIGFLEMADDTFVREPVHLMTRIYDLLDSISTQDAASHSDDQQVVTPTGNVRDIPGRKGLRAHEVKRARQAGATLQAIGSSQPERRHQQQHYGLYRSTVVAQQMAESGFIPDVNKDLIYDYGRLGGTTESEIDQIMNKYSLEDRVLKWLLELVEVDRLDEDTTKAALLMGQQLVPNVGRDRDGNIVIGQGKITMLQLLTKRSIEIERRRHEGKPETDAIWDKLARIERMTREQGPHSYSAQALPMAILGGHTLRDLTGDSSIYIGSQMTPDQMLRILMSQNLTNRRRTIERWRRQAGYVKERGLGDPPYKQEDLDAGLINSFAIVVDSVAALANVSEKERDREDERGSENFAKGFKAWKDAVDTWSQENRARHATEGITTREQKVEDLLTYRPDWARALAKMIPSGAHVATFTERDGKIGAAKWVLQALAMTDAKRAEVHVFVYSQWAIFNEKQGTSGLSDNGKPRKGDGKLKYSDLDSQFLRMLFMLGQEDPTYQEVYNFIEVASEASSLLGLRDAINGHPNWLRTDAPWHPYVNDVSAYESNVTDLFGGVSRDSTRQLELDQFAKASAATRASSTEYSKQQKQEAITRTQMKDSIRNGSNVNDAKANVRNLEKSLERKLVYPDALGPAVMKEFFGLVLRRWGRGHDKGKPPVEATNVGIPTAFVNSFGLGIDIEQEQDAITANDVDNLLSNPSRLVREVVRLNNEDGSETIIDMTSAEKVLAGLDDPVLHPFAMAVIEPTVRDLNAQGAMTRYADRTKEGRPLQELLERTARFTDVFDENLPKLERALRGIGMVEAALANEALTMSLDQQDQMNHPIMRMIADYTQMYTTSVQGERMDTQQLYERTVIAVWEALLLVADTPEKLRTSLQATLEAAILDQWGDPMAAFDLYAGDPAKAIFNGVWFAQIIRRYQQRQAEIQQDQNILNAQMLQLKASNPNDPQIDVLQQQVDFLADQTARLNDSITELSKQSGSLPRRLFASWEQTLNKYQLTGDPDIDLARKKLIATWLINGNQGNRFDGKAAQPLVEALVAAWGDSQYRLEVLSDDTRFTPKMWNELGAMAAAIEIESNAGLPASWTSAIPLNTDLTDVKSLNKYFDRSGASLTQTLFDPLVTKAMQRIIDQASRNRRDEFGWRTTSAAILKLLYPKDLALGEWDSTVVKQALWVQQLISGGSTPITIPVGGDAINRLAENIAAELATPGQPAAEHYTSLTETFTLTPDQNPKVDLLDRLPVLKLENHFFSNIVLTPTSGNVDPQALADFHRNVGIVPLATGGVNIGNHRLYQTSRVAGMIQDLREQYGMESFSLQITFVDVDKKPYHPDYVNSPLFDGLGRDAAVGGYAGPMGAMFFGLGAIANVVQQEPLNALTKAGQAFRGFVSSKFSTVEAMERPAQQGAIKETIERKTMHMFSRKYVFGFLLESDLPAVHKWVKSRHLVSGFNPETQQQELWWSERYITAQETQDPNILQNPQLINISNKTYRRLIGTVDGSSTRGEVVRPALKLQNVNVFPVLTMDRLRRLGLESLGTKAGLRESDVRRHGILPKLVQRPAREPVFSELDERSVTWRKRRDDTLAARAGVDRTWTPQRVATIRENDALAQQMAGRAYTSSKTSIALIPDTVMRHQGALQAAAKWTRELEQEAPPDSLTFVQMATLPPNPNVAPPDPSRGQFDSEDAAGGWKMFGDRGPVYQDRVVMLLESYLLAAGGDVDDALKMFKRDAAHYASRGVTIVLGADTPMPEFNTMVGQWLESGEVGYRSYQGTISVFVPLEGLPERTRVQQTQDSTRIATRVFTRDGTTLQAIAPFYGTSMVEGTAEMYVELEDPEMRAAAHTIMPGYMTGSDGSLNSAYVFGFPHEGTGPGSQEQALRDLRVQLEDPTMFDHFLKALGPDPQMPIYKDHPNGTFDPGVLSAKQALEKFRDSVIAGELPGIGSTAMTGGIVALVSPNGTYYLQRAGFKPPTPREMDAQRIAQPKGREGRKPHNIVVSTSEFDDNWTIAPPFLITDTHPDINGLHLYGEYDLHYYGKWVDALGAFKAAQTPASRNGQFATPVPLGNQDPDDRPIKITRGMPDKELVSKGAKREGLLNNWRNQFALTGWDARTYLLHFFGHDVDRMSKDDFETAWNELSDILNMYARITNFSEDAVSEAIQKDTHALFIQQHLNEVRDALKPLNLNQPFDFADRPAPTGDPRDFIARRVLAVLGMEGVTLADLAYSKGLIDVVEDEEVVMLPDLLTSSLIDVKHPEVHDFLVDEVNARIYRLGPNGKPAYTLKNNWKWDVQYEDRETGKTLLREVMLQIILPTPAKENIVTNTQAVVNRGPRATSTPHTNLMDAAALGGLLVSDRDLMRGRFGDDNIVKFADENASFFRMLTNVSRDDKNYVRKPRNLPLMQRFIDRATTKVAAYHHRIDRTGWTSPLVEEKLNKFLGDLNLDPIRDRAEVDYLVRQFWGAPGPINEQEEYSEQITEELFLKALTFMQRNISRNMHPLHGGVVPFEHKVFWEKLYKAQVGAAKPWAPVAEKGGKLRRSKGAESWDEWVASLVAQMRESDQTFSTAFGIDVAGFWQTYQGSMSQYDITSASPQQLVNLKMMDPDSNEFVLSLDPNTNALLSDPMLLDTVDKMLDALTGMTAEMSDLGTTSPDAQTLGDRVDHITRWQKKQGLKPQKNQSFRSYMREGQMYMESDRELNTFVASLLHLQIINRLFLPALWAAAYIEVPFRSALEHATDILTGNHAGLGGQRLSEVVTKLGWTPRLSPDDIQAIQAVAPTLGASNELMREVFQDYTKRWHYGAEGSLTAKLASAAGRVALLFADPRRGMRNATIGRLYMNGVLEYAMQTDSSVGVRQIVHELAKDPMFLAKEAEKGNPGVMTMHKAGLNRVSQTRGFRRTFTGKVIMSPVSTLLGSSSAGVQLVGGLLFVPFAFTSFLSNYFVMITGMQAADQALARLFDQRQPWALRLRAVILGSNYNPEEHDRLDMTDVLDGMDMSRAVIQSGISWTSLFTLGLIASSMGLSGEDEEERKRRLMAQRLNLPTYIDPIKPDDGSPHGIGGAEHDFRQVDAIYLDETPLRGWYQNEDGRSAVVPHWVIQQYTAPLMGMARAFETGDLRPLFRGFWEAAAVIPYSAVNLWRQTNEAVDIMTESAEAAAAEGTADGDARRRSLWVSTVGMMERALIDNQFLNSLWTAFDEVDRAPWLVPQTNDIGQIVREPGTGFPVAQEQALQPTLYTDPVTGEPTEVGAGYWKRNEQETAWHMRAEKSPTYAILRSIFTGQWNPMQSSYNRFNMVPRGRDVPLKPADENLVEASLYAAFTAAGGQQNVTEGEVVRILRHQAEASGQTWDQSVLEAQAQAIVEAGTGPGALSVLDDQGREMVTQTGMDRIIDSLMKGSITLDHPSMRGVWASRETLAKIEAEWQDRIIEESMAWGMTKQEAGYRWRRFWWGDPDDPEAPGLKYLFDKIPTEPDARYTQLNVTYIMGPDGKAWATPFTRQTVAQALGIPLPHQKAALGKGLTMDSRANVVDEVLGINTGLNALMKNPFIPEEQEDKAQQQSKSSTPSYGARKFKRYPSSSGGYTPRPDFIRMLPLPETGLTPRPNDIPFINTNTPQVRRADVRRERITSERGRLKQWQ